MQNRLQGKTRKWSIFGPLGVLQNRLRGKTRNETLGPLDSSALRFTKELCRIDSRARQESGDSGPLGSSALRFTKEFCRIDSGARQESGDSWTTR
ncbi:hypothetical protein ACOME3_001338 [Neoechinorhynchus agilis]